jgi:hypothetical protein
LLLLTPFSVALTGNVYSPDLLQSAFIALSLLALARHNTWVFLILMWLAQLTRETTLLLSVVVAALAFRHQKKGLSATTIAVALLGLSMTSLLARGGGTNIHHMNGALYALLKAPYNVLKNVLGLLLITNTQVAVGDLSVTSRPPLQTYDLPQWLQLGEIRRIYLYIHPIAPLSTLRTLLVSFGVLPWVLLRRRGRLRGLLPPQTLPIGAAAIYGSLLFIFGAALGAGVERLMGGGWPAFLIATPLLLSAPLRSERRRRLLALHVLLCWLPIALKVPWHIPLDSRGQETIGYLASTVAVASVLQVLAYRSLRAPFAEDEETSPA